jgi:peptide deformylase
MTIRPILITGEPVLHVRAKEVTVFDDHLRELVQDMYETMDKAPGVGLAAPQIGVGLRVFVYDYADDEGKPRRGEIVNPVLTLGPIESGPADEDTEVEGCLSAPGERFPLKRADEVFITGVNLNQQKIAFKANGWFARIMQHEFDHLDGLLYLDRLSKEWHEERRLMLEDRGWGKPGLSWLPGKDDLEG